MQADMMFVERVEEIFERVRHLEPELRERRLQQLCAGNETLRMEIRSLLAASDAAGGFLSKSFEKEAAENDRLVPHTMVLPEKVGAYRLGELIGEGGVGRVYAARRCDGQFEKMVAVKFVHPYHGPDTQQRFMMERRLLARLDHPYIARLIDGGMTREQQAYLIMEYVRGTHIDVYCRNRDLGMEDRLGLFLKVCEAVAYLHDHGIIHRDLKPANILIDELGNPKILDFGIAKMHSRQDDANAATTLTRAGLTQCGLTRAGYLALTPEYAAPEQVNQNPITAATDVYALGIILYELLCGERAYAFHDAGLATIVKGICEQTPKPPSRRSNIGAGRRLRGDLDRMVMRAIAKKPNARYQNVRDFMKEIQAYLRRRSRGEKPIRATPVAAVLAAGFVATSVYFSTVYFPTAYFSAPRQFVKPVEVDMKIQPVVVKPMSNPVAEPGQPMPHKVKTISNTVKPVKSNPARSQPGSSRPARSQPASSQPGRSQPGRVEPAKVIPVKASTVASNAATTEKIPAASMTKNAGQRRIFRARRHAMRGRDHPSPLQTPTAQSSRDQTALLAQAKRHLASATALAGGGRYKEAMQQSRQCLRRLPSGGDKQSFQDLYFDCMITLAHGYNAGNDPRKARDILMKLKARQESGAQPSRLVISRLMQEVSETLARQGKPRKALKQQIMAYKMARNSADGDRIADLRHGLGLRYMTLGRPQMARRAFNNAMAHWELKLERVPGDKRALAELAAMRAQMALLHENLDQHIACTWYQRAMAGAKILPAGDPGFQTGRFREPSVVELKERFEPLCRHVAGL